LQICPEKSKTFPAHKFYLRGPVRASFLQSFNHHL